MCFWTESLSTSRASASRTAGSDKVGCLVPSFERSPSISVQGSVKLIWMCSMPPPGVMVTRPLPPFSRRCRISSSTCRFQAKSYSPVCSTARAARRDRVAAALHLDGVEVRLVVLVVVRVDDARHHVRPA